MNTNESFLGIDKLKNIKTNKKKEKQNRTVRFANISLEEDDEYENAKLYNESSSGNKMD